ncbi:hypothetical protein ACFL59_16000, partial [Planctomycetota bacterium]
LSDRRPRRDQDRRESSSRAADEELIEIFVGFTGTSGRHEVGYTPGLREVRITTEGRYGDRRELRYRFGEGLEGVRDLADRLRRWFDGNKRTDDRNRDDREERRPRRLSPRL